MLGVNSAVILTSCLLGGQMLRPKKRQVPTYTVRSRKIAYNATSIINEVPSSIMRSRNIACKDTSTIIQVPSSMMRSNPIFMQRCKYCIIMHATRAWCNYFWWTSDTHPLRHATGFREACTLVFCLSSSLEELYPPYQ